MTTNDRLELMGAPGSPYTRKMVSLLRYRRIPHNMIWGGHRGEPKGRPDPKVKLLPTFYFPKADGSDIEAIVDSTPIIRRLETDYAGRSVIPSDPATAFINDLIEDFADEWLTKPMFHYRWAHGEDAKNAGPLIIYWQDPTLAADEAAPAIEFFTKRQIDRLYVVGSNEVTAKTIEESYKRLLKILDELIQKQGYVLGARPASADFAIFGQLTQLGYVEPTSARLLHAAAPRVRAWMDRMEDLSGLEPEESDWASPDELAKSLKPFLNEIGRVYAPFLLANAQAVHKGEASFTTQIDGRKWTQPTFPYQAKCLAWLRETHAALPNDARETVAVILAGTGCEPLLGAG